MISLLDQLPTDEVMSMAGICAQLEALGWAPGPTVHRRTVVRNALREHFGSRLMESGEVAHTRYLILGHDEPVALDVDGVDQVLAELLELAEAILITDRATVEDWLVEAGVIAELPEGMSARYTAAREAREATWRQVRARLQHAGWTQRGATWVRRSGGQHG